MPSPHGVKASAHRPVVMGLRGAVASGHPLASRAGIRILEEGGNAVDAAIAVGAALNVVEPHMSGIGGDGFIMIYSAERNEITIANGTGAAPLRSDLGMFRKTGMPRKGILSVSVPGLCDAWLLAHDRYGRLSLEKVLAPAIELCEEGFPVSHKLAQAIAEETPPLASIPFSSEVFCPDGRPLRPGEICRNDDLAKSFRLLAREGRAAFYEGEIAGAIVGFSDRMSGLLSLDDFKRHRGFWQEPVSTLYRGYRVFEAPPNSSGLVLLQELNLIEHFEIASLGWLSAESIHAMVEAKRLAFADREAFLGDPDRIDVPVARLISKAYAAERAKRIRTERAMHDTPAGNPFSERAEDTTCFAVVDRSRNAVCQLQSLQSPFGSGLIAAKTGILLNNRMSYWHLEEGHPDCLEPGKRVRHTMNPVMVFNPSARLFLVLGTPGADTQVQTNLQILSHILHFGLNPQEAVEAPRWRHLGAGTESEYPHGDQDELRLEARFEAETINSLVSKGHRVKLIGEWEATGSAMVVAIDPGTGALLAGADPRRDGYAIAC